MATAILTAKKAAREHRNKVFSEHLHFKPDTGKRTSLFPVPVLKRGSVSQLIPYRQAVVDSLEHLLPIEEGMRETLENDLAGVDELLSAVKPRRHRYPILSVEPLTWRDEQGYPKLVIMALDQPGHVEIRGDGNSAAKWHYLPLCDEHKRYSEVIKRIIVRCYRDVGAKLVAGASNSRCERQFIRMELGKLLIPPETREKISKARKFFDDQIFLIAEAGKWVEGKVVLPKPDPLIVGYEDGLLFLIDIFDLKRIEDIARSEFVVPQPKELK